MFVAKQKNHIACIGDTEQECIYIMNSASATDYVIEETEIEYELYNGEYLTQEEIQEIKQEQFKKDFFNTSLGYVSRKVHMKDGSIKDFLTDILPLLQENVPIITYNIDGTQNTDVMVTEQFLGECKQQLLIDFYGAMSNEST